MKNIGWVFLCLLLMLVGCDKYDDSELRSDVQNLENRVNALERWQSEVNSNITSLQSVVNALKGTDYLNSVTELKDASGRVIGYTLQFAKSGTKNIYHGKDGQNGAPGQDGADGITPLIGAKLDSDGVYYWTLNGQWLLDKDGNRIQASGTNGKDGADGTPGQNGITPKLKIENGFWYVSYDNELTWEKLSSAVAEGSETSSACIFKGVTVSDAYVTFVLADGSSFALPYGDKLDISFSGTESILLSPNATVEIPYEIQSSTSSVDIEVIGSSDLFAEVVSDDNSNLTGKIKITTNSTLNNQSKVVVLVTNGSKIIMRSLTFEKETLEISDNTQRTIPAGGGEFTLEFLTNVDYDVIISDDAKSWITSLGARAVTKHTLGFQAAANTGNLRIGSITIESRNSGQKIVYNIIQSGSNSITLGADNGVMPCAGTLTAEFVSGDSQTSLDKLVDNDLTTCYEISGKSQFTIIWEGEEAIPISKYYIHFGSDSNKAPKDIVFYGSKDGVNWDALIGIGGNPCLPTLDNDFPTKTRYKYIKLEVKNTANLETVAISEFHLIPASPLSFATFDDVVTHGSSFTTSSSTPMGTHYENKHVTTDSDKEWLSTATNEPNVLSSAPSYTWRTYTVDLYPYGEPVPADVNQHGIGDCSALAVFADLAYMYPDFIKSIITDHGDGTYTVDMYDPQGKPVEVTVQSTFLGDDNGIGAVSGKKGEATWATILEKAIMKWNYIYQVNPDINGIGSEHVAPLFTGEGNSFAYSPDLLTASNLKKVVELSLEKRMIVIGGFTTSGLSVGSSQTVTMHAYSFFYSNQSSAMFAMRNPWGWSPPTDAKDDGILNIEDDGVVPPTIDLRIIYPGAAANYAKETLSPYIPPVW